MVTNAGRMIAAMAMITSSVRPERRGGFMSANSSVQHIATGIGASIGGLMIKQIARRTAAAFRDRRAGRRGLDAGQLMACGPLADGR